jgi:hypothetical protein
MDLIIIGGGCYGCYHTRQLLKAQRRGTIAAHRFLVIDRNPGCRALAEFADESLVEVVRANWSEYLHAHLASLDLDTDARLVPAPFAPHLLLDWLLDAVRADTPAVSVTRAQCALALGLPYEHSDAAGNRYISAADWLCPATCIEPARCPAIRAERTWELGDLVRAGAAQAVEPYAGVELFTCRHFAFGVGTIPVADLVRVRQRLATTLAGSGANDVGPRRILVGTVSACHGVLGELTAIYMPASSRNRASTGR